MPNPHFVHGDDTHNCTVPVWSTIFQEMNILFLANVPFDYSCSAVLLLCSFPLLIRHLRGTFFESIVSPFRLSLRYSIRSSRYILYCVLPIHHLCHSSSWLLRRCSLSPYLHALVELCRCVPSSSFPTFCPFLLRMHVFDIHMESCIQFGNSFLLAVSSPSTLGLSLGCWFCWLL